MPSTVATQFGDPLAGLTPAPLTDFAAGLDEFESVDTAQSGLGPIFNNVSCVALHGGRAATVDAAIRLHDGEAARVRDRCTRLNPVQQQQLDFLESI